MSQNIITAQQYQDPKLADIRTVTGKKNDNIPFLLLPVRVETRFMKANKKIYTIDPYKEQIYDELIKIDYDLRIELKEINYPEYIKHVDQLVTDIDDIVYQLKDINEVSNIEYQWLNEQKQNIYKSYQYFSANISNVKTQNQAEDIKVEQKNEVLSQKIKYLNSKVNSISENKETAYTESAEIIDKLNNIENEIDHLKQKDLSTNVKTEKKKIYVELEKKIANIYNETQKIRQNYNVNLKATSTQIHRIKELNQNINKKIGDIPSNLNQLKSHYKRAEYITRFSDIENKEINKLKNQVDQVVIPKLEFNHDLRLRDAKEIQYDISKIYYDIRWINSQNIDTYKEVKTYRERIYEQLIELRSKVHEVIEATPEEITAISEAWEKTDKELEKFVKAVRKVKGKTRYEKAGISRAITHINEEYRKDLEGLKKAKEAQAIKLDNQSFTNSAVAYKKALNQFKKLEQRFKEYVKDSTIEPESSLYRSLIEHSANFNVLSRNMSVMPKEYFDKLNSSYKNIERAYQQINTTRTSTVNKNPLSVSTENALANMKKAITTQRTDVVDFKDPFYDEYRKPLVYSYKTVTVDELWVRIYPDDIAIHTHEEALTEDEVNAGKAYWKEIWAASGDYDLMLAAWRAIVAGHGSQRAAWIVKKLDPSTVEEENDILNKPPSYNLVQVIKILEKIDYQLSQVGKKERFTETLDKINIEKIHLQLIEIEKYLKSIKRDNSRLLMKANRLFRKVYTKLSALMKGRAELTNSEISGLEDKVTRFDESIVKFNSVINNIREIKTITTKEILKEQKEEIKFPKVEIKEESWTIAPHTRVMPEQFVVLTMNNDKFTHIVTGAKIAKELKVGLDPEKFETDSFTYDSEGNLIVDDDIKWMTDYEEAVKKGMGISIELTEDEVEKGFDKLLVLGVKDTTSNKGQQLIEDLLNNHHYIDEGMSILPIGTPTNNTDESKSGFSSYNEDDAETFKIERNNETEESETDDSNYKKDGTRVSLGLGVDKTIFQHIQNTGNTEISDAFNMNKALWPATLGTFMSDILDSVFTLDNIKRTRNFFTGNVTARGIISSIRIGTQPYGILPTTAFSRFMATNWDDSLPQLTEEQLKNPSAIENELQTRFDIRFKEVLFRLYGLWKDVMKKQVKHAYNTDINNPQQHFMDMLGLHATSVENYYRYSLNVVRRRPSPEDVDFSINFTGEDYFGPDSLYELIGAIMAQGYYYTSDWFMDEQETFSDEALKEKYRNERIKGQLYGSRLYKSRNISEQAQLVGDLIDSQKLSDTSTIEKLDINGGSKTYIEWLLSKSLWNILNYNDFSTLPSNSLLFMLLRQSLMTEYRDTGLDIMQLENCTDEKTRRIMGDAKHYHTYSPYWGNNTYVTKWTYLFNHFKKLNGLLRFDINSNNYFYNYMKNRSMASYLINPDTNSTFKNYPGSSNHRPLMNKLEEVKNSISKLNEIPTAKLSQLLAEHIDLCTYRLDAWMLGLANKRLEKQRTENEKGVFLGAYGWLENLRHGGERKQAENIPEGLVGNNDTQVYTDEDNQGFIHAPSIGHAITAAVLRSGFIANKATSDLENQFAINLSSERVRMALSILEGVRNGQEIGAVLGYQFERGLHERYTHLGLELDKYIYDFREKFPLVTNVDSSISITNATANVVHGLDLLEEAENIIDTLSYNKNMSMYEVLKANVKNHWPWLYNLIDTQNELDAVLKEIDRLANTFDALGDLVISESVYQVVKGNHKRASVLSTSLSEGKAIPDIHIIDTPRTGIYVTHKVLLHYEPISGNDITIKDNPDEATLIQRLTDANAVPPNWGTNLTPRSFIEPSLNKWLGELIGDPSKIKCTVNYTVDKTDYSVDVSLYDLALQPLDFIYIMGAGFAEGGGELNNRIAYYVRSTENPQLSKDVELEIKYTERNNSWAADVKTFYEVAPYARYLLELVSDNNPVTAEDLIKPGEEVKDDEDIRKQDINEFEIRVLDAYTRLDKAYGNLTDYYTNETDINNLSTITFTEDQLNTLREYMMEFSWFGISGSIPETITELSDELGREMVKNSQNIYKIAAERLKNAQDSINNAGSVETNDQKIDALTDAARYLFGKSFNIYPHYKLRNPDEVEKLITMDTDKGIMRDADTFAIDGWVQGISKVRKRMGALQNSSIMANAFDMNFPQLQPIQLPFIENTDPTENDHWTGIDFPETYSPSEDKLSVVLVNPGKLSAEPNKNKAGILIDQWVEIIPNKVENTGVTFNYDQPDAKPPQNLLLAVTPQETGKWKWDDLVYTLLDTLELSKIRAVESEHLDKTILSQVLPAIMGEVVPPQLKEDESEEESASNPLGVQVVMDFGVNNEKEDEE